MGVDVGAHLDFLDLDDLLALARLGGLLLALIFQLAEIGELADGRILVGRYLDEIEAGFLSRQQRVIYGNDAPVVAVIIDKLNPWNPDLPVGARTVLDGCRGFEWSANGRSLLSPLTTSANIVCGRANFPSAVRVSIAQDGT